MKNRVLGSIMQGFSYVREHPQLLFVFVLIILMPLVFLYSGQQFLDAGRANQDKLEKDRIGSMEDALAALLKGTKFDHKLAETTLRSIALQNPDITDYSVAKEEYGDIIPFVASASSSLNVPVANGDLYREAAVRTDTSIIFESYENGIRYWSTYRAIEGEDGIHFLYLRFSMQDIDALFAAREESAYFSLIFIFCFLLALAYWHIRLTDYRFLYMQAKQASKMKDIFTNMIAHELRAPLTAIKGYAAMLEEHSKDNEQKKYSTRVRESAERLIAIVNDLLEVARIQSGKLKIEASEYDIVPIITAVLDELRVSAEEKHISLIFEKGGAHVALIDPKRLHQALTNLVSNAIKYTESGSISLSLEDKHAFVELRVKDTGMGISADDQKNLFAPFFRVQNAEVEQITGSGLGMWISKQFVELMNGSIDVESIKGVGTHIVVKLPRSIRMH